VAVIHCKGYQPETTEIAQGNAFADKKAKRASTQTLPLVLFITSPRVSPIYTPEDRTKLTNLGAKPGSQGWLLLNEKFILPSPQAEQILKATHQTLQIGAKPFPRFLQPSFFHPALASLVTKITQECPTCAQVSPQGGLKPPPNFLAHQLRGSIPGEDWQVNFTHMTAHKKLKYLLTLGDTFSGWVEAFPTMGKSAEVVSTHLIKDIIPQFGLPWTLQSDNGPAFISKVTQIVSSTLGVTWNLHIPYHPQSLEKVERMNGTIKGHLKKLSIKLHLHWNPLLPLALTQIRATPRGPSFLSPFEIVCGHPFLLGNLPPTDPAPLADHLPYLNLLRKRLREHSTQE
jgi:transposase InsO family protein